MQKTFPRHMSFAALAPHMSVARDTAERRMRILDKAHGSLIVRLTAAQERVDMVRLLEIAPMFFGKAAIVATELEELRADVDATHSVATQVRDKVDWAVRQIHILAKKLSEK